MNTNFHISPPTHYLSQGPPEPFSLPSSHPPLIIYLLIAQWVELMSPVCVQAQGHPLEQLINGSRMKEFDKFVSLSITPMANFLGVYCCDKDNDQQQLREERVYLSYTSSGNPSRGKSGKEL